jgi:hypothetical protein
MTPLGIAARSFVSFVAFCKTSETGSSLLSVKWSQIAKTCRMNDCQAKNQP